MCLYPKLIKNKKYTKNKKNGGVIPAVSDIREKTLLKDWIYQGVNAGVALLEGVTDIVKVKSLIKAAEVI